MSKRLPYFKFDVMSWLTGNIRLLSPEEQGIFISLCALIWRDGGTYKIDKLTHRQLNTSEQTFNNCLQTLTDVDIVFNERGVLSVKFIDEQIKANKAKSEKCAIAGRKSAKARTNIEGTSTKEERIRRKEKGDSTPKTPKGAELHDLVVSSINWPSDCDVEVKELFLDFLEERRIKRSYVTERALKALFKSLNGFTREEQIQALNKAIAGGHKSLYPEKSKCQELDLSGPEWQVAE